MFSSLRASYIHQPRGRRVYLQPPDARGPLENWTGLTPEDHGAPDYDIRNLPDQEFENEVRSSLPFYCGLCVKDTAFLMTFGQPYRVRLAYSPNDGGKSPEWSYA